MSSNFPVSVPGLGGGPQSAVEAPVDANGPDTDLDRKIDEAFWFHPSTMDGKRWDQQFPYQFLVLDQGKDGTYTPRGHWVYTLPIPPEAVTIDTPFAAVTTVTQGGIVEETAGFPLKHIDISGTTGVLPTRPAAGQPGRDNPAESILAGTIAAFNRTVSAITDIGADLTDALPNNLIDDALLQDASDDQTLLRNTGYWQARMMVRFLEAYATLKKSEVGPNVVLAFAVWKDEACYLVTPNRVRIRKASDSPMEHKYQITLTAWARVKVQGPKAAASTPLDDSDKPGFLAEVLNVLKDVQTVLEDARDTVQAFVADADRTLFEPIREAILISKDALGVPLALIDMPAAIVRDAADTFVSAVAAGQELKDFVSAGGSAADARKAAQKSIQDDFKRIKDASKGILDRTTVATGWSKPGYAPPASRSDSPLRTGLDIFNNPSKHARLMAAIAIDKLRLPPVVTQKVNAEVDRVKKLSRGELTSRKDTIFAAGGTFDNAVGAGDATYAATFGQPTPSGAKPLGRQLFRVSASIQAAVSAYQKLLVRGPSKVDAGRRLALQTYVERATSSGIPAKLPRSKFPVPFPYGTTLEQMAVKYLGDPQRVGDIIALNGLRAPYVDEVGITLALQAPGFGRSVVVQDTPDLHVGQTVWLESNAVPRTKRRISNVVRRNAQATLTLDGEANLEIYSTIDGASLHLFRPGTVNSQMTIFIPSDREPDGIFRVTGVAEAATFDPILSAGGIDLLLTSSNDLVVTPDGDGRWATGLNNLTQLFRILMQLRRGTLLLHLDRGMPIRPGDSVADSPASVIAEAARHTLTAEPAFSLVRAISVQAQPPGLKVAVSVEVAGTALALPLSVDVVR